MNIRRVRRCAHRRTPIALTPLLCGALLLGAAPNAWAVAPDDSREAVTFNDVVRTVVYDGDTIYVGGLFTAATDSSGTETRNHVAAVDAATGELLAWDPNANRAVRAIAVDGGDVYLGGDFSKVGGVTRRKLAKVSATSGAVDGDFRHTADRQVLAMTVLDGSLYAGGKFTSINGSPRGRLAAFDLATGDLRGSWRPTANAAVLTLDGGPGRVYAGGRFGTLNGRSRSGFLGAVTPANGSLVGAFDASISYLVYDVEVTGTAVYAGADGPGGHLRAFAPSDGDNVWDLPTDGGVQAVTELDGTLYFGGHFDNACRASRSSSGSCRAGLTNRRKLAAADTDGTLLDWAPQANSNLGVVAMDSTGTDQVAAGGAFTRLRSGSVVRPFFALFG